MSAKSVLAGLPGLLGLLGVLLAAAPMVARAPDAPWTFRDMTLADQRVIICAVIVPEGFDPGVPHPVLLALPPGNQDGTMVEWGLTTYWAKEAVRRGWVVVSPVTPRGLMHGGGMAALAGPLLDVLTREFNPEGGKFHLAGMSTGGRAAVRVAVENPERFHSLTVLPGMAEDQRVLTLVPRLKGMHVRLFVADTDEPWVAESRRLAERLTAGGVDHRLYIMTGEDHVLKLPTAQTLFDLIESFRPGRTPADDQLGERLRPPPPEARAIAAMLDDLHDAAARADGDRYFAHFALDAVFLGTDATERWTLDEFKAYARPHFSKGVGWAYTSTERHITLSEDRRMAWFDELLTSDHMGQCRGSGVARLVGQRWKLDQYNLSVPIPNELAKDVVRQIREHEAPAGTGADR